MRAAVQIHICNHFSDNQLATTATWDDRLLGEQLKMLADLNISVEGLGFDTPEIDLLIGGLADAFDNKSYRYRR